MNATQHSALIRFSLRHACLALAAMCALPALAYPAGAPGKPAEPSAASPAPVAQDAAAQIRAAEAQARLAALEAAGGAPADAPPGTPAVEIAARLAYARQLVSLYDRHLDTLRRVAEARERRNEAQRGLESWRGFENAPPRPVLLIDALRDELDAAGHAAASARDARSLFERFQADYSPKLKAAQSEARLAAEAAGRARGSPEFARLEWSRSLAALRADVDSATQALLQTGLRAAQAELNAAEAARELARHKLIAAGSEITLGPADLEKIHAEIEERRVAAERALQRASVQATEAQSALKAEEDRQSPERAIAAASAAGAARLAELDRELTVARELAATANERVFLLREKLLALEGERLAWQARAQAMIENDPVEGREAYTRLTEGITGLRASKQYLDQQLVAVTGRIRDEETRQRSLQHAQTADDRLLQALRERESDLRAALDASAPLERLIEHFRADLEGRRDITPLERARDALAAARLAARQIWNYEMFTIEDTFEAADGRKIAVSRAVTVGKTFGAVLIVIVGYLLSDFVLGWIERWRVARGRASPQQAALGRKWILFALSAILVIFALFTASIPLTAFAFLGGALAIAAGFGSQTLLKNLVSGGMLLAERPLRIGDLVEVDGIRGRVTEIGLRASTIRNVDGIESIIPNSRFLEGNMTNWTYSSTATRQTIKVGVAYGSALRRVNEILNGVAQRHGLVLKDPAPQVYFEAYGESSIEFALTYWVQMTQAGDSRRIKSDLLHMIDAAFGEAGITIPFPQRDLRLATDHPVPVTVVSPAAARAAA